MTRSSYGGHDDCQSREPPEALIEGREAGAEVDRSRGERRIGDFVGPKREVVHISKRRRCAEQPSSQTGGDAARQKVAEAVIDGRTSELQRRSVVLVADRLPRTDLHEELVGALDAGELDSLQLTGDADAPGLIAQAVFAGHRAARQFGEPVDPDAVELLREG